jgi:hypothetical protein
MISKGYVYVCLVCLSSNKSKNKKQETILNKACRTCQNLFPRRICRWSTSHVCPLNRSSFFGCAPRLLLVPIHHTTPRHASCAYSVHLSFFSFLSSIQKGVKPCSILLPVIISTWKCPYSTLSKIIITPTKRSNDSFRICCGHLQ